MIFKIPVKVAENLSTIGDVNYFFFYFLNLKETKNNNNKNCAIINFLMIISRGKTQFGRWEQVDVTCLSL